MWGWLNGFVHSSGFGGLAAVVAAAIAYLAATKGARAQSERADEDRWWDQAKWATERLAGDDSEVALGIATFQFLVEHAPDSQAAAFVTSAVLPVLGAPDLSDIDGDPPAEAHLDQGQEVDHGDNH
ncbi:MAG: hypothetical protein L0H26_12875 [Microlunatus sp.]|nr:hypothetical protein [Microlunatus sp.]